VKILVIGAGVIGTTYGWQFARAGYDVTHFVRSGKLERYRSGGIRVNCVDMRRRGGPLVSDLYLPGFTRRDEGHVRNPAREGSGRRRPDARVRGLREVHRLISRPQER